MTSLGSGNFLKGIIIPFYGELKNIPEGWLLCDGTNGTPDLRGKTLIGTGTISDEWGTVTYKVKESGGERLHKLTIKEMPSHNHTGTTNNSGLHNHGLPTTGNYDGGGTGYDDGGGNNPNYTRCFSATNGLHNHNLIINNTGSDNPHNLMQPYLVVNYIIKI